VVLSYTRYTVRYRCGCASCFRRSRKASLGLVKSPRLQLTVERPAVTGLEARTALLHRSIRSTVPLRKTFVQAHPGGESRHGPLSIFVANGDVRALRAFLIVVASASNINTDGWTTTHDSLVWARLLDAEATASTAGARTAAWRTLGRLQERRLIARARGSKSNRDIAVTLLREDGSGQPYTHPAAAAVVEPADWYLRLPVAFWTRGYDAKLGMPGLAMLLTVARERPWSSFPAEKMPEWYGWSPDTAERGLRELLDLELAERRPAYRRDPLSPIGSTLTYQYRLKPWLRPKAAARPGEAAS
jgi:hypothetical protein